MKKYYIIEVVSIIGLFTLLFESVFFGSRAILHKLIDTDYLTCPFLLIIMINTWFFTKHLYKNNLKRTKNLVLFFAVSGVCALIDSIMLVLRIADRIESFADIVPIITSIFSFFALYVSILYALMILSILTFMLVKKRLCQADGEAAEQSTADTPNNTPPSAEE